MSDPFTQRRCPDRPEPIAQLLDAFTQIADARRRVATARAAARQLRPRLLALAA